MSQADVFLVLTTYGQISSEFDALKDGGWLLTAYLLSQSVAQPLVRKQMMIDNYHNFLTQLAVRKTQ